MRPSPRLRDELRAGLASLPNVAGADLPKRVAHGDLKISNLLFDDRGAGVCLVDLDTLAEMILPYELGDAWRSWCNPLGEDDAQARFDVALFDAAWRGYMGEMTITPDERALLVPGIQTICLELSARFARDVVEDKYFGWDASRFPSRAAHNLVRAQSQVALYRSLTAQRAAFEAHRAKTRSTASAQRSMCSADRCRARPPNRPSTAPPRSRRRSDP